MIFTEFPFFVLMAVVLPLYFMLPLRGQNVMLLVASYVFYGWWDWRFLFLLFFSTVLDYCIGLILVAPRFEVHRKAILVMSITTQLLLLGVFKYYDFFLGSAAAALQSAGLHVSPPLLNLALPVGISFYTFHTISYTVDIYRRLAKPTTDFIGFALFISFFPQLVAGPIARASHLLPQCLHERVVSRRGWAEGTYLFFWGLFKKVVVADNLAVIVNRGFDQPESLNFFTALCVIYAFAWQIYCDFSGYTDMARGISQWMGFDLQVNFNVPYLAVDPTDFWQRWHISLSTWLRDYLYIPLGGNRYGVSRTYINLMLTMLIGGLWHGANWTFVLWGLYHGLLLCAYRALAPNLATSLKGSFWRRGLHQIWFFHLVCISWLLFRSQTMEQLRGMTAALFRAPVLELGTAARLGLALPVFVVEYLIYRHRDQVAFLNFTPWPVRAAVYVGMYWTLIGLGRWTGEGFIYFQF
jgi:alginate O-acetyltransferase complex protein AlgI